MTDPFECPIEPENRFTLEKLKIVDKLQEIAQSQAIMKEQMNGFKSVHEGINKILDRHDLILLGDGSTDHAGMSARLKILEDDMGSRKTHNTILYTGVFSSLLANLYHFFFGGK